MKKITNLPIIKSLIFIIFVSFINVSAADTTEIKNSAALIDKNYSLAVRHMTNVLKNDFNDSNVDFKLTNLHQNKVNKTAIQIYGEGLAVFNVQNDNLPVRFSFSTDADGVKISNLDYEFTETAGNSNDAPDEVESTLMREIMKKINKDYKTTQIVIAIDDFQKISPNSNVYEGSGEIKVNETIWRQIDFKVKLNDQNKTAEDVVYKIVE